MLVARITKHRMQILVEGGVRQIAVCKFTIFAFLLALSRQVCEGRGLTQEVDPIFPINETIF